MQSELLKRLFRSIASRSWQETLAIARLVVSAEDQKGHSTLASELRRILSDGAQDNSPSSNLAFTSLGGGRGAAALTVTIPKEKLRRSMVMTHHFERRVERIEKEYAARHRLARFGLRNRSKLLFYGPPGNGKSLAAEVLGYRIGLPVVKVRFDALMSSYFGESASNLRQVFDAARMTPCVLVLDEFDYIARSRSFGNDVGEAPRIVNAFLQLLEEHTSEGLLVATTNLSTALDPAVFRRFDETFDFPPPDRDQIELLLRQSLSGVQVSPLLLWRSIEERLLGLSASAVVSVAHSAAKEAVLGGERVVEQRHFETALRDVTIKPPSP